MANYRFFANYYHYLIISMMVFIVLLIAIISFVLYQVDHQPLPTFTAAEPNGTKMDLTPYESPNLLPDTILQWAMHAATAAYTFDFVHYNQQIELAHPYFTDDGWNDYVGSVRNLLNTIVKNQLVVNGVVSGPPVISNQGPLPGIQYAWRVQIPFLVTYQSANTTSRQGFYVILSIIRIPTSKNPQGIGIDQFIMVRRG